MMIGATRSSRYQRLAGTSRTPVSRLERLLTRVSISRAPGEALLLADLRLELGPDVHPVLVRRDVLGALEQARVEDRLGHEDRWIVQNLLGNELLRLVVRRGVGVRDRFLGLDRRLLDEVEEGMGGDRMGRILEDDPGIHPV